MKKEKERNLTLEQLEKKRKILDTISLIGAGTGILVAIISMILAGILNDGQKKIMLPVYTILLVTSFGLSYFCLKLKEGYTDKIDRIKKQKK